MTQVAKLHMLAKQPYFMNHGYVDLVVVEVSRARDVLTFLAIPPRGAEPLTVSGTLAIYRQLEAVTATLIDEIYVGPCDLDVLAYNNPFVQLGVAGFDYPVAFNGDPDTLADTANPNIEGGAYTGLNTHRCGK